MLSELLGELAAGRLVVPVVQRQRHHRRVVVQDSLPVVLSLLQYHSHSIFENAFCIHRFVASLIIYYQLFAKLQIPFEINTIDDL